MGGVKLNILKIMYYYFQQFTGAKVQHFWDICKFLGRNMPEYACICHFRRGAEDPDEEFQYMKCGIES